MSLEPSTDVQYIDVRLLSPWDKNPRSITDERFASLKRALSEDPSMMRPRPIIALAGVDFAADGTVVGGNMRQRAAQELVESGDERFLSEFPDGKIPCYLVTLTEESARLWALRDNNGYGDWDLTALDSMLGELRDHQVDLDLTGFTPDYLNELSELLERPPETPENYDGDQPSDRGQELALADVSIGDPKHQVETHDVWSVGPHLLVVEQVYDGWSNWIGYLDDEETLFVPYPTPTLPLTVRANNNRLMMVQPDKWLAGHLLDKYAAVKGDETVEKLPSKVEAG